MGGQLAWGGGRGGTWLQEVSLGAFQINISQQLGSAGGALVSAPGCPLLGGSAQAAYNAPQGSGALL
jgi:hypothetical protein